MSLYVLDTDHLSLYQYGHREVSARLEATPADDLAVTIITIEEQLRAWYTQLPRLGKLDLSIAAIALEFDGIVVTRNRRDLEPVPNLQLEDRTQPQDA